MPCAASRTCGTSLVGRPMRTPVAGSTTTLQPYSASCALAAATRSARSDVVSTPVILALWRFWKFLIAASIGSSPPVEAAKSPDHDNAAWIFCRSAGGMPASASLDGAALAASGLGAAGVTAAVLAGFASGIFASGALASAGFASAGFGTTALASAGRGCGSAGATAATLALVFLLSARPAFLAAAGAFASAGFTAVALWRMCFFAGFAAVSFGIGMMPGESCAGAGAAPSKSTSIARNGP